MTKWYRYISALAYIIIAIWTQAQSKLQGRVYDQLNGQGLPNVIVLETVTKHAVATDLEGNFSIEVSGFPATIQFRLLGYEVREILVANSEKLSVAMKEVSFDLNTVEITASQVKRIAGNAKRSIWDYTWSNDRLVICDYGTSLKSAQLFVLNDQLDSVFTQTCPDKPVMLFTDCMGNGHLQGRDSTWQIFCDDQGILFYPGESNYYIDHLLKHCVGSNEERLFFAIPQGEKIFNDDLPVGFRMMTNNDEIYYFYGNRSTNQLHFLTSVSDMDAKRLKDAEITRDILMHSKQHGESPQSSAASKFFFYHTMLKEIYAPLFALQDSVCLMDYIHGKLVSFDSTMSVDAVNEITWTYDVRVPPRCIANEEHTQLYLIDQKDPIAVVYELKSDGSRGHQWKIPHPFPDHISIRGKYIYYLHRDEKDHLNRFLSRMEMR